MSEPTEDDSMIAVLAATLSLKWRARADRFMRSLDLTAAQGRTIGYIEATQDRGVIQRELVEVSRTTAASVSSLLDGLEKNGYIERRPSPDDARQKLLYVLPKGKGLTEGFDREMHDAYREMVSPLSEAEQATLIELLQRITVSVESRGSTIQ